MVKYTYDALAQIRSMTVNGVTASFTYDANGNRISKKSGSSTVSHVWDASNIIYDDFNGTTGQTYVHGMGFEGTILNGIFQSSVASLGGDVVKLENIDGDTADIYKYEAFGNEQAAARRFRTRSVTDGPKSIN